MIILRLTLKKKFFDMIASGEKKEEYREIKPYWVNRLLWHEYHSEVSCVNSLRDVIEIASEDIFSNGVFRTDLQFVEFKNGYRKNARTMIVELNSITYGDAKPEWSENWVGELFVIKLGNIIQGDG